MRGSLDEKKKVEICEHEVKMGHLEGEERNDADEGEREHNKQHKLNESRCSDCKIK